MASGVPIEPPVWASGGISDTVPEGCGPWFGGVLLLAPGGVDEELEPDGDGDSDGEGDSLGDGDSDGDGEGDVSVQCDSWRWSRASPGPVNVT